MSKPVKSSLIESFMSLANEGAIREKDGNREAWDTLLEMYSALHSILNGENSDVALKIDRTEGVSAKPSSLPLAIFIYYCREVEKEKWVVVEKRAEKWLADRDLKPVGLSGLRPLYDRHRAEVEKLLRRRDQLLDLDVGSIKFLFAGDRCHRHLHK